MTKTVLMLATAVLAGCLGGIGGTLAILRHDQMVPQRVVRARSYELVDEIGNVVSRWGVDQHHNPLIAFGPGVGVAEQSNSGAERQGLTLDDRESQRTAVGLTGDARPFLMLRGRDTRPRVSVWVGEYDKPVLLLRDENAWRVALGIRQTSIPGPDDDDWGLEFYPDRSGMGMGTVKEGMKSYVRGYLYVHKNRVPAIGSSRTDQEQHPTH